MAVKRCRRTGKSGYRSVKEAEAALREIESSEFYHFRRYYENVAPEIACYPCLFCPRWHLTSERQLPGGRGVNLR